MPDSPVFCLMESRPRSSYLLSKIFKFWLWLALSASGACAQGLTVTPAAAAPGEWAILSIAWHSPSGKLLSALQWDTRVASSQLQIPSDHTVRLTLTAADEGKSVACHAHSEGAASQILRCIVSGGVRPIPDGTIALLSLKVAAGASSGPTPVNFEHVLAVGPDLHSVALPAAQTTVTVRRK